MSKALSNIVALLTLPQLRVVPGQDGFINACTHVTDAMTVREGSAR